MTTMTNSTSKEQTFIHHLIELRDRLIRAGIGVLLVFVCLVYFSNDIYNFVATPLLSVIPEGGKMIATDVIAPFLVPIKLTLWISFFIAIPWVLYQIWSFVAPGLYRSEERRVGNAEDLQGFGYGSSENRDRAT